MKLVSSSSRGRTNNVFLALCLCLHSQVASVVAARRFVAWTHRHHENDNTFTRLGRLQLSRDDTWWETDASEESETPFTGLTISASLSSSSSSNQPENDQPGQHIKPASVRAFGRSETSTTTPTINDNNDLVVGVTLPLIPPSTWEELTGTGTEFDNPEAVDRLARSGLMMATQEGSENEWVDWKPSKDTEKILQSENIMTALDQDEVLVYVGKAKKEGYGSHLPLIKTQSILPMAAEEMADLLMDSSRVKIYNKMSLGRVDLRVLNERTKIVRNLTKPPVAKSNMVSVTLMHKRNLTEEDTHFLTGPHKTGYLVVSRAVPGADTEYTDIPRNDILLGVNLLQDLGPNECMMTAVTHIYSPSLPTMLASRLGVSSAINFVKDIRGSCVPVAR
jgi:hypothetical protein